MFEFVFSDFTLLFPSMSASLSNTLSNVLAVVDLALLVLLIIAEWRLFKKYGEKPWKSLIPFYSTYIMYKHTWTRGMYLIYVIPLVCGDVSFMLAERLKDQDPGSVAVTALVILSAVFGIITSVMSILAAIRIAEAFGKGLGFGLLTAVFYTVFVAILAFGRSTYNGNPVTGKGRSSDDKSDGEQAENMNLEEKTV